MNKYTRPVWKRNPKYSDWAYRTAKLLYTMDDLYADGATDEEVAEYMKTGKRPNQVLKDEAAA